MAVNALSIPAAELETEVSAKANRYAGRPEPHNPTIPNWTHDFKSIPLINFIMNGMKQIVAMDIRIDAICIGLNATRPFLIRINELPHIIPRTMKESPVNHGEIFFASFN